ncbi:MAG TPA: iron chelate uptake ABC transporter family permease subunit [Aeromicrobium sp.]|nr:iron chelate uptake ABC transporter family permease subunit [Aeromicrobium sp.]
MSALERPKTTAAAIERVATVRRRATFRARVVNGVLIGALLLAFSFSLAFGERIYSAAEVGRFLAGQPVPGAAFTIGELRLPRALLAILAGAAFALAGVTFQTLLRNPLASPDIIGITNGASVAALFMIIVVGASGLAVSAAAVAAGIGIAFAIYLLAARAGVVGTRLILIGIGVAAMANSATLYLLSSASRWDLQGAMRWLSGSLNLASWEDVAVLAIVSAVLFPAVLALGQGLALLRLGDDQAAGLGVNVERSRRLLVLTTVALAAFATAATGPITFVAFMSGPIAARLIGPRQQVLLPAGLIGALLVLSADLIGQFAFSNRYPVGVVTGVLGAPFLIYLMIRSQRVRGSI